LEEAPCSYRDALAGGRVAALVDEPEPSRAYMEVRSKICDEEPTAIDKLDDS
jgi:hypothetical protein